MTGGAVDAGGAVDTGGVDRDAADGGRVGGDVMDGGAFLARVRYGTDGLVPCVVQDARTREVLMLAYGTAESLAATLETGEAHFWSRSRGELWRKGATSGNLQQVVELRLDCDHDTVLVLVEPAGPACHTGAVSCFREAANDGAVAAPAGRLAT